MRKIFMILLLLAGTMTMLTAQQDTLQFEPSGETSDSLEYELIVMDPGYDSYLVSQPSMDFHSQQYYENWNYRYVTEWNMRNMDPLRYGDIYEVYIDYRPEIDYGKKLNYRLYHYFRFFEKENGVDLLPGKVF